MEKDVIENKNNPSPDLTVASVVKNIIDQNIQIKDKKGKTEQPTNEPEGCDGGIKRTTPTCQTTVTKSGKLPGSDRHLADIVNNNTKSPPTTVSQTDATHDTPSPNDNKESCVINLESPPSPPSPQQQNGVGKVKRPIPLRMTTPAPKRPRSGSSEPKIPMEHQRSLREFYEAGGRDYKEYLSWLSAMSASGEHGYISTLYGSLVDCINKYI